MSAVITNINDLEFVWRAAPDGFASGADFKTWLANTVIQQRAELAQLRSDLQAAQERIADLTEHDARTLERCDVCGCALISDVLEGDDEYSAPYCPACRCEELSIMLAEQARQTGRGALRAARAERNER